MLHEFIAVHREEIIRRCRAKVATRSVPAPTRAALDHGVPLFLEQLADALRPGPPSSSAIGSTALLHGHDRLLQGFSVSQVVHDYGDVCQAITELAVERNAPISTEDFRTLNRYLDDAIAEAVTEYGRGRAQSELDEETARGSERLGFFAHELRNLTNTAILAFEVLQKGTVGAAGSTATVLHRSLMNTRDLIGRSLAEVRLAKGILNPERFLVSEFIAELMPAATLSADAHRVALSLPAVDDEVVVEADRQVLRAAVMNLLQNAFKFTRPRTTVTLRVAANPDRVLIEIEDECSGLPGGNIKDLFRPFEQRGLDRGGLGLGLAFSRWAVEASHGRIYARNLADVGCVFTIDLPRFVVSTI